MLSKTKQLAVLAAILVCGAVRADPTSDKLTQIEVETLLLKARERQLDVQASILTKQNDIAARQTASQQSTQSPVAGDPVVQGMEGVGGAVFATLQLSDGSIADVQVGDVLVNGMRVVSIAPGGVIVQQGKKRVRLARHSVRQAAFNPHLPSPGLMLPLPVAAPKGGQK
jgi:type IV pilus biogenesis protein PilP